MAIRLVIYTLEAENERLGSQADFLLYIFDLPAHKSEWLSRNFRPDFKVIKLSSSSLTLRQNKLGRFIPGSFWASRITTIKAGGCLAPKISSKLQRQKDLSMVVPDKNFQTSSFKNCKARIV